MVVFCPETQARVTDRPGCERTLFGSSVRLASHSATALFQWARYSILDSDVEVYRVRLLFADTDECVSMPCRNGGRCVDDVNMFQCLCTAGYTDDRCQTGTLADAGGRTDGWAGRADGWAGRLMDRQMDAQMGAQTEAQMDRWAEIYLFRNYNIASCKMLYRRKKIIVRRFRLLHACQTSTSAVRTRARTAARAKTASTRSGAPAPTASAATGARSVSVQRTVTG